MAASKLADEKQKLPEHKLVNIKSRGGIWKVTAAAFEIFCIVEKVFIKHTETCFNKTDSQLITKVVQKGIDEPANFWKLKSNMNYAELRDHVKTF